MPEEVLFPTSTRTFSLDRLDKARPNDHPSMHSFLISIIIMISIVRYRLDDVIGINLNS